MNIHEFADELQCNYGDYSMANSMLCVYIIFDNLHCPEVRICFT